MLSPVFLYIGITPLDVKGKMIVGFELQPRSGRQSSPLTPQLKISHMPIESSARMDIFKGGLRQIARYQLMLKRIIKKIKKNLNS